MRVEVGGYEEKRGPKEEAGFFHSAVTVTIWEMRDPFL